MNWKNLNPYELQVLTTALFIMLFEVLHLGTVIKKMIYKKGHRNRIRYVKPWDCRFCFFFWIGMLASCYYLVFWSPMEMVYFMSLTIITSRIYDYVFTK